MGWYEGMNNEGAVAAAEFPPLDIKASEEEANRLFTPYIFFHHDKKGTDWWCSSCMSSGRMERLPRTIGTCEMTILYAVHNGEAICPVCGKSAQSKNSCKLGKRKNLLEFRPVVFLKEKDGDIYARAYWARKNYQGALDAAPDFSLSYGYKFSEGKTTVL